MRRTLRATAAEEGTRADRFLAEKLGEFSRTGAKKLIEGGWVEVNNQSIKPSYIVRAGDQVEIEFPPSESKRAGPQPIPLDILYEDDEIIVVNKPAGLVTHHSPGHPRDTLVNGLLYHCELAESDDPTRPGIVHRLDKETSGVIVAVKTERAYNDLVQQFKSGEVEKRYITLVHGILEEDEGLIAMPIGRDRFRRQRMQVTSRDGKRALTEFVVLKRLKDKTLVEVRPKTGRTHQIRVHFSHIGHPIVGDIKYGKRKAASREGRLMLHAEELAIWHPRTGKRMRFSAPLPPEFKLWTL